MAIDFAALASRLLSQSRALLAEWYPHGKLHGHEFKIGDVYGSEGESLSINVNTGQWGDFAADLKGGDLISLYAAREGISQAEAARKLDGDYSLSTLAARPPQPKVEPREKWTPIIPIPDGTRQPTDDYYRKGPKDANGKIEWIKLKFIARWPYTDDEGRLIGYAVRFEWFEDENGQSVLKKDIVPQVFAQSDEGKRSWRWRSFPTPRPLYNLAELRSRPDAPVIVVEGEKKVEALRIVAPQYVGIAWPGGSAAWRKTDWTPLKGRQVLCWPDADKHRIKSEKQAEQFKSTIGALIPRDFQPGMLAMWEIGHHLLKLCPVVKVIIPDDDSLPDGWDAADAARDGWTWQQFKAWALPRVFNLTENGNATHGRSEATGGTGGRGARAAGRGDSDDERSAGRHGAAAGDGDTASAAAPDAAAAVQGVEAGASSQMGSAHDENAVDRSAVEPADGDAAATGRDAAGPRRSRSDGESERGGDRETGSRDADTRIRERVQEGVHERNGVQVGTHQPAGTPSAGKDSAQPQSQIGRWLAWGVERNGNGIPIVNLNNAVRVLECDPQLRGLVWFDEFLQRLLTSSPAREWTDSDDINLMLYMQREIGISKMGKDATRDAVITMAMRDRRNCVRDWLATLKHDGTPRIDEFMINVFGAEPTEFARAVSRNFFIGLVARVFEPGCKQDNIVVLEGAQGLSKSSALMALVGAQFYSEQHESATNVKAFAEILQGKWLIEVSEMDAFARSEVTRVKQVASCQSDRYRDSYARYASDHPRQCSMAATANKDDWNRDETGARRFWPIACKGAADLDYVHRWRTQLFAEAVRAYLAPGVACEPAKRIAAGSAWWIVPEAEARNEQRKRYDADPWLQPISYWLAGRTEATVNEIAITCLRIEMKDIDKSREMRIAKCLRVLGWQNEGNKRRGGAVVKVWTPGSDQYGEPKQEPEVATERSLPINDLPFQ